MKKFYPKHNVIQASSRWIFIVGVISLILFGLLFVTDLLFGTRVNPKIIGTIFIVLSIIAILLSIYINYQVKYIMIENGWLKIRYYNHRNQPDFLLKMDELKAVKITRTVKGDKFYELVGSAGQTISVDLNAIPDEELTLLLEKYNIKYISAVDVD